MVSKKLPKLEFIVIGVFFIVFLIWAVPKCSATKKELNPEPETTATDSITVVADTSKTTVEVTPTEQANPVPVNSGNENLSRLYVTIDKLKLRKGPDLDSAVVQQLNLFDEVYFLNEVTDFKTTLNLGLEEAEEPWVKVKTKTGQSGWVFGAGVNYYKKKREGVLE